jgi:nitrate reductase beta subunit
MKIRAQIGMVLNLDKCIGCHTCSVTCKNVWTSRDGVEYAWFNNVESKPGIGYPKDWENQEKWQGGWERKPNGKLVPKQGGKMRILANIFANPNLPRSTTTTSRSPSITSTCRTRRKCRPRRLPARYRC